MINLSKRGLDDSGLSELISDLPARSIALIEEIDAAFLRGVSREASSVPSSNGELSEPAAGVTLSGLLASIDGIQASEGRLLFATTNRYHALDSALIRAGRLDVHVEFRYASQAQAEELFKRFFPADDKNTADRKGETLGHPPDRAQGPSRYGSVKHERLNSAERDALARRFAEAIPDCEFAMASIQGLLLNFKNRPSQVLEEVSAWVDRERSARKERERALVARTKGSTTVEEHPQPPTPPPEHQDHTTE